MLVELFGTESTKSAIQEVMATGHVGAEYVEYILRHKRRLEPNASPLRVGKPELDNIVLFEPDLTRPTCAQRSMSAMAYSDPAPPAGSLVTGGSGGSGSPGGRW